MLNDLATSAASVEAMASVIGVVVREGHMPVDVATAMVPYLERLTAAAGGLAGTLREVAGVS